MWKTGIKGLLMIALMAAGVACAAPLKTQDVLEIWPNGVAPGSENAPVKLTITERVSNSISLSLKGRENNPLSTFSLSIKLGASNVLAEVPKITPTKAP